MWCASSFLMVMLFIAIVSSRNDEYSMHVEVYRISKNVTGDTSRIDCPGEKKQSCADGYTCCESPSGDYSCCPQVNAVCCPDRIHCCPQGSSCEVGRCKKDKTDNSFIDMYGYPILTIADMMNSLQRIRRSICPGDEFQCPLQTTCCKVSGGKLYGCCPFEEAVCCADELHCCPKGFECTSGETCVHSNNSTIPFSTIN